jgi:hypothetical protein
MSIDNQIIDRIIILRNEFLQNFSNESRILFSIRNILLNIDEMNINDIHSHLTFYYSNYNIDLMNQNSINYITFNETNINSINDYLNFNLNTFDRNSFNYDQVLFDNSTEVLTDTDTSEVLSDIDSLSESDISTDTDSDSDDNDDYIPNILTTQNINNYGYSYNNYVSNWPNNINSYSNLLSINNFSTYNLPSIEENVSENTTMNDIPLVIKESSLQILEFDLYKNLDINLKNSNQKCMINLRQFNEEDIVRILPCNHIFIKDDIDNWLRNRSHKCPICRCSAGDYYAKVN